MYDLRSVIFQMIRIVVALFGLFIMELADPATVTVGVRVEFVDMETYGRFGGLSNGQPYIYMESNGEYETTSSFCEDDNESGVICK